MTLPEAAIYTGQVVHKRLRPKPHALSYKVFSLLVDTQDLAGLAQRLRLFSHNRFNIFAFHDADFGPGDGTPVADIARRCLKETGRPSEGRRILLLAYPRVLGYAFNPISVYYVYAPSGQLETLIYEVSNTFGERKSYVAAAGNIQTGGVYAQACGKEMFVSPFASGTGGYGFRITEPGAQAVVAVNFRDAQGPLIKTHFSAKRAALCDRQLARLIWRYPLMTFKVIAAIHYQAMKLFLKRIPLAARHVSPRYSIAAVNTLKEGQASWNR